MVEGINGDLSGIEFHFDVSGLFTEESYQRDIEHIFKKSWLALGHDYDLPNAGDFKTKKIPGLNYNVLIVRGKDNKIRAFHNICRHRGNMLVCKEKGSSRQGFSCAYHGWTYNVDGTVRGLTDRDQFPPYGNEALGPAENLLRGSPQLHLSEFRQEGRESGFLAGRAGAAQSLRGLLRELPVDGPKQRDDQGELEHRDGRLLRGLSHAVRPQGTRRPTIWAVKTTRCAMCSGWTSWTCTRAIRWRPIRPTNGPMSKSLPNGTPPGPSRPSIPIPKACRPGWTSASWSIGRSTSSNSFRISSC
jgi:nitrite reductase/ring-hydroxylating ferredoxin subunit